MIILYSNILVRVGHIEASRVVYMHTKDTCNTVMNSVLSHKKIKQSKDLYEVMWTNVRFCIPTDSYDTWGYNEIALEDHLYPMSKFFYKF